LIDVARFGSCGRPTSPEAITEEIVSIKKEVTTIRKKNIIDQVAYGILLAMLASAVIGGSLTLIVIPRFFFRY
jgi:hypothetical protein